MLVGRDASRLERIAADLRIRGATEVRCVVRDLSHVNDLQPWMDALWSEWNGLDLCLVAQGTLPDTKRCESDIDYAKSVLELNADACLLLLLALAARFEAQASGQLLALGSVAGDRGRAGNYVYGAAKAALATLMSGLEQRLAPRGVQVLTIKPGWVDTPMTAAFRKGPLWASAEKVARDIVRTSLRGRSGVVYSPAFWRPIAWVVRMLPGWLFRRWRF